MRVKRIKIKDDFLPCYNNLGLFPMMLSVAYDSSFAMDDAKP